MEDLLETGTLGGQSINQLIPTAIFTGLKFLLSKGLIKGGLFQDIP